MSELKKDMRFLGIALTTTGSFINVLAHMLEIFYGLLLRSFFWKIVPKNIKTSLFSIGQLYVFLFNNGLFFYGVTLAGIIVLLSLYNDDLRLRILRRESQ